MYEVYVHDGIMWKCARKLMCDVTRVLVAFRRASSLCKHTPASGPGSFAWTVMRLTVSPFNLICL